MQLFPCCKTFRWFLVSFVFCFCFCYLNNAVVNILISLWFLFWFYPFLTYLKWYFWIFLLLGLMFRSSEFQLQIYLPCVLRILNTSVLAKLCVLKKVWLWLLLFLMLKCHYCRFLYDRFFFSQKPVFSFALQESAPACYFFSIFALRLPSAWWCFQNLVLCVHDGTESASTQSAEIKCWTDLATCLMDNS